jgi:GTP-binding protein LepA
MPETGRISKIEEPFIEATILTNDDIPGRNPAAARRKTRRPEKVRIHHDEPRDARLRTAAKRDRARFLRSFEIGFERLRLARLSLSDYKESNLVKLDILVSGEPVDALSLILHRHRRSERTLVAAKMKELIPRQMFEVPIQAAIGNKVIARETVKAMGKNVIAKCYGGDISRKRKLLENKKKAKSE